MQVVRMIVFRCMTPVKLLLANIVVSFVSRDLMLGFDGKGLLWSANNFNASDCQATCLFLDVLFRIFEETRNA